MDFNRVQSEICEPYCGSALFTFHFACDGMTASWLRLPALQLRACEFRIHSNAFAFFNCFLLLVDDQSMPLLSTCFHTFSNCTNSRSKSKSKSSTACSAAATPCPIRPGPGATTAPVRSVRTELIICMIMTAIGRADIAAQTGGRSFRRSAASTLRARWARTTPTSPRSVGHSSRRPSGAPTTRTTPVCSAHAHWRSTRRWSARWVRPAACRLRLLFSFFGLCVATLPPVGYGAPLFD